MPPTSPTARYLSSGLKETHVAAFILSLAVHVLVLGESPHSPRGDAAASGDPPTPASLRDARARLRDSREMLGGVEGGKEDIVGFTGVAVGLARKKRWVTCSLSSSFTTTAAAPAV